MFFRAFAALVAADAFDRRMRERQRRAWIAADNARAAATHTPPQRVSAAQPAAHEPAADHRHDRT